MSAVKTFSKSSKLNKQSISFYSTDTKSQKQYENNKSNLQSKRPYIKRGMVFFLNVNNDTSTHIPTKTRPFVVLSNDKANSYSPFIHVAPIYTRSYTTLPTQVYFTGYNGRSQIISIEDIMCVPIEQFPTQYDWILPQDIIDKCDLALKIQFNIDATEYSNTLTSIIDRVGNLEHNLNNIIETLNEQKEIVNTDIPSIYNVLTTIANATNNLVSKDKVQSYNNSQTLTHNNDNNILTDNNININIVDDTNTTINESIVKCEASKPNINDSIDNNKKPKRTYASRIPNDMLIDVYSDIVTLSDKELIDKYRKYGFFDHDTIVQKKAALRKRIKQLPKLLDDLNVLDEMCKK